ncbi:uncharacterized protein FTOL_10121 [Fusarium torulosum]|uniref:Uncharacterized protein n=1 Tax=Fusarium torulosum TaxID=33205 RepID=A0AAE8SLR0_9HYPO|nr:uncharacterized protein FTOL_10121 [Fusarium torulosum]
MAWKLVVAGIFENLSHGKALLADATAKLQTLREKLGEANQAIAQAEEKVDAFFTEHQTLAKEIARMEASD